MSEFGSGAKGKKNNIYTISVSVGQQYHAGKSLPKTVSDNSRCMITDRIGDMFPESKGLVINSYVHGMTPVETFFEAAGLRGGSVQNATTTPTVGWVQRELEKATENIVTEEGSAVFHGKVVLEWCYGGDSYDGLYLSMVDKTFQACDIFDMVDKINSEHKRGVL